MTDGNPSYALSNLHPKECQVKGWPLWLSGLLVLSLGALVYVLARGGNAYFVPEFLQGLPPGNVSRHLTNQLPTFLHTFAFAIFLVAIWSSSRRAALLACSGVTAMEILLELGQQTAIAQWVAAHFPGFLFDVPIINLVPHYFVRGTFDLGDVLSILMGGLLSVVMVLVSIAGEHRMGERI